MQNWRHMGCRLDRSIPYILTLVMIFILGVNVSWGGESIPAPPTGLTVREEPLLPVPETLLECAKQALIMQGENLQALLKHDSCTVIMLAEEPSRAPSGAFNDSLQFSKNGSVAWPCDWDDETPCASNRKCWEACNQACLDQQQGGAVLRDIEADYTQDGLPNGCKSCGVSCRSGAQCFALCCPPPPDSPDELGGRP